MCEGSTVTIDGWLYFSNPASTLFRERLTLRRAPANVTAAQLPPQWLQSTIVVNPGAMWGAYSAIVPGAVAKGVGGLLYENGTSLQDSAIVFVQFPLDF